MICSRCKNPTELTFEGECEWCGHGVTSNLHSGGARAGMELDELSKALIDAETQVRSRPGPQRGFWGLITGESTDNELENKVNRAKAAVVSNVRIPEDRPTLEKLIDLAETSADATKVKWYDASGLTEGQEELHKAWKALAKRAIRRLERGA